MEALPEAPIRPYAPHLRIERRGDVVILRPRFPDVRPALRWALRAGYLVFAVSPLVGTDVFVSLGVLGAPALLLLGRAYAARAGAFQGGAYRAFRRVAIAPRALGDGYREEGSRSPSLLLDGTVLRHDRLRRVQLTRVDLRGTGFAVSLVLEDEVVRLSRFDDEETARRFAVAFAALVELEVPPSCAPEMAIALRGSHAAAAYLVGSGAGVIAFVAATMKNWNAELPARALLVVVFLAFEELLLEGLLTRARADARAAARRTFQLLDA